MTSIKPDFQDMIQKVSLSRLHDNDKKTPSKLTFVNPEDGAVFKSKHVDKGGCGKFCVGVHLLPNYERRTVGIKVFHLPEHPKNQLGTSTIQGTSLLNIQKEVICLKKMYPDMHIHVLQDPKRRVYVLMDLMCGTLWHVVCLNYLQPSEKEKISCLMLYQVSQVLDKMHRMNYVHCDVKPENIFLHSDGSIRLADFGLVQDKNIAGKRCGTLRYIDPNMLLKKEPYCNEKSDIWSLGVSLIEVLVSINFFAEPISKNLNNAKRIEHYIQQYEDYKIWHATFVKQPIDDDVLNCIKKSDNYFDQLFELVYTASPSLAMLCFKYLLHPIASERFCAQQICAYIQKNHADVLNTQSMNNTMQDIIESLKEKSDEIIHKNTIMQNLLNTLQSI